MYRMSKHLEVNDLLLLLLLVYYKKIICIKRFQYNINLFTRVLVERLRRTLYERSEDKF